MKTYEQHSLQTAAFFGCDIGDTDHDHILQYLNPQDKQWHVLGSIDITDDDVDSILNEIDEMISNNCR